jgi:hypothetical protein
VTGYLLAGKQGDEARKTAKIDRRITAIREASELVYRRGPALEDKIYFAWGEVDSILTAVNSNSQWPYNPVGASLVGEIMEAERKAQAVIDSATKTDAEADQLLADGAIEEAFMSSLFEGSGSRRFPLDVPVELEMTLQEKARVAAFGTPKLSAIQPLSGRPLTVPQNDHSAILTPEASEHLKALQTNIRELVKDQLQLSKTALEGHDQLVRNQLVSLYNSGKFAIEHLNQ